MLNSVPASLTLSMVNWLMQTQQQPLQKAGRIFSLVMGIILLVAGVLVIYYLGIPVLDRAKASPQWPTTKGVVLKSKVASQRSSNSNSETYKPDITYRYEVDGQQYECTTVWFGSDVSTSNRSMAQDAVNQYPVNGEVVVYYDPQDPAIAVLQPGAFKMSYFYYLLGWGLLGPGILMVGIPLFKFLFRIASGSGNDEETASADFAD